MTVNGEFDSDGAGSRTGTVVIPALRANPRSAAAYII